jgi:hypothetical protein
LTFRGKPNFAVWHEIFISASRGQSALSVNINPRIAVGKDFLATQIFRSRFDPCRLVRQVKEIIWLEGHRQALTRPLPVHPAGESDSSAYWLRLTGRAG